ncbi:MAG: YbfB/YjiJ family MFS transporter, partial [bacterium]|nr:YbfB/YjiJ family MFS transporter [bacterium]
MDLDASLKSARAPTAALAGALVMAAAVGIGRFAYTPLLPPMQEALGWSVSQAGDIASSNFVGYMLGALVASALTQRAERRRWLFAAMLLSVVTTCAGGVVVSFPAWLGIRFFAGIASAFCLVLSTAIISEFLASCSRPQLGALHFAGVGVGIVVSVLVIELVRLSGFSVFGQWAGLGITSIALLAGSWLIARLLPNQEGTGKNGTSDASKRKVTTPPLLKKLIVAYGLFGFGYVVTATFIVAMARRLDHATLVEPLTWIVFGLIAAPSVFAWQRLALRFGMFPALRLAYGVEAVGVLLAGFGPGHVALVTGGALLGGTFMGITALGLIAARQIAASNQGRAIGWMTASFGLGQLLGPAIAGRLAQMTQGFEAPS